MLVNCVAYKGGHKLTDLSVNEVSDYLKKTDSFVWVALKDPDPNELKVMTDEFDLHPLAVEDAQMGHQRPKIEEYGDSLFVVLQTVEISEDLQISLGEVDIFVGTNFILSVRNRSSRGFQAVRDRCELEPELLKFGSAFVLYALMDSVVDRYFPVMDELEKQLEQIEERIFSKSASARLIIEEVYELKSKLMLLQHTVNSLREAVAKLHGGRVPHVCVGMADYFRDISDHLIRISKSIESVREMSTTAIQVNLSLISLSESEVTKKLASYGALFALPTLIAGIYGMNFTFLPGLHSKVGYPLILAFMILLDGLLWLRFRRAHWL